MNNIFIDNIKLNEEDHIYILQDDPEFNFTSSTTFLHKFFDPFDKQAVADSLLKNVPKYKNCTKEELFKEWEQSATIGTHVHLEVENYILTKKATTHPKSKAGAKWIDGVPPWLALYPEKILYSTEIGIAGMIDLLIYDSDTDEYVIVDWKTNKKISKNSYKGKMGSKKSSKDLEDCNFIKYSLQLSLYRYILEEYYGMKVKNSFIVHLKVGGSETIKCPYLKESIIKMLEEGHD
ncbi:PD-(D/E)XK nuclease family protein [bacterium]|nr:PD-(D/E)XK nuclease family protein [bacterium]